MSKYINEEIVHYFSSENDRAIMINGDWGSGKTYYLKEELTDYLDEELKGTKTIYLSLYGVESIQKLKQELLYKMLSSSNSKLSKMITHIGPFFDILLINSNNKAFVDVASKYITKDYVAKVMKGDLKFNIILDDLERSTLDYLEVMGFINNLSEHSKDNVIVVANESELYEKENNRNIESRYIVSLLADKIGHNYSSYLDAFNTQNIDKLGIDSLQKLNSKSDAIFIDKTEYQRIKEKTIYKTYNYVPEISTIYDNILKKMETVLVSSELIMEYKENIINIFKKFEIKNMRTLQTIFRNIDYFYQFTKNRKEDANYINLIEEIVESTVRIVHKIESNNNIYFMKVEDSVFNKYVKEYLAGIEFDKNEFGKDAIKFLDDRSNSNLGLIRELETYWNMNDKELEELIQKVNKKLIEGYYPPDQYTIILYYNIFLKQLGFNINVDEIYLEIKNLITRKNQKLDKDSLRFLQVGSDSKLRDKSKEKLEFYLNDLDFTSNQANEISLQIELNNYIDKDDHNSLMDILDTNLKQISDGKGWLYHFDMQELSNYFRSTDNTKFVDFLRTVNHDFFYSGNFSKYDNDRIIFREFVKMLKEVTFANNEKLKEYTRETFMSSFESEIMSHTENLNEDYEF